MVAPRGGPRQGEIPAMPPLSALLHRVCCLAGSAASAEPTDRELLARFASHHDEEAFARLVRREAREQFAIGRLGACGTAG